MTATLPPAIKFQPLVAGQPIPGGTVKFYAAGTTTPQAVYAADGTTPIGTELTLDANGSTSFRLGSGLTYKIDLYDALGAQVAGWPEDNVQDLAPDLASTATGKGDALIGVKSPLTGGVARTQHDKNADVLSVKDFGAVGDGTTDDTAAVQAALNAAAGRTLVMADESYLINTITMSNPNTRLQFGPKTVLVINDELNDTIQITAENCTIDGARTGKILGKGTWDGTNTAPTYSVIKITAAYAVVSDLWLYNIRRNGISSRDTENTTVTGCRIDGNYPSTSWTGVETVHFGIFIDPGPTGSKGNYLIANNIIRTCVQGLFIGNYGATAQASGVVIADNVFEGCLNHGIYDDGTYGASITGNSFSRCQTPIVCLGSFNSVVGNALYTDDTTFADAPSGNLNTTGISMRDPYGCVVSGNTIRGNSVTDGAIIDWGSASYTGVVSNNICVNNTIEILNGTCVAIRMGNQTLTTVECNNNLVANNRIKAIGTANKGVIELGNHSSLVGYGNRVLGNDITVTNPSTASLSSTSGIYVVYQDRFDILDNSVHLESDQGAAVTFGGIFNLSDNGRISRNRFICSASWGTNVAFRGYWGSGANYNIIENNYFDLDTTKLASASPIVNTGANDIVRDNIGFPNAYLLSGTATIALGAASVVVPNTNVLASSNVIITPSDGGGGKLAAAPGVYVTQTAGTEFSILTADGTNAAQASSFRWVIR